MDIAAEPQGRFTLRVCHRSLSCEAVAAASFRVTDLGGYSVDDLAQDTQQDLSDDGQLEDLKTWHYARLYAGSDEPDRLGKALNELRPRPSTRPNVRRATKSTEVSSPFLTGLALPGSVAANSLTFNAA